MLTTIQSLPDSSRIWIFPADRKLTASESSELLALIDAYLANWKAHEVPVQAARDLRYDQFLVIAADPQVTAPSGCSIDDLTRAIKALSAKFGVDFFSALKVFYKEGDEVRVASRSGFKSTANPDTIVFDNSITTLGALRAGKWELPASESWHKALLNLIPA
ncbi:MAG: hypothetical protein Q8922_03180 [Bacteroidota bacterium]|nr:hypothetical protein [Bacteroidota bacterium]MDP4232969.1 hypothetical protein [Bacteroidota bacterium]MDP4242013.1 hypothetical protein [Bacteroidota bacterium]MDP4286916.1 hypothetical protein [Bacteroidota bacterium]